MARGNAPYFYVRPDEAVLRREGAAPGYAVQLFVALALPLTALLGVFLVADLVGFPALAPWRPYVVAVYVALLVVAALVAWRRQATSEYVLTDQRVYARVGRVVTSVHFTTHDKVTDLRYRQGPLQRMLGVSGIVFATAGGDVRVSGVRDAIALKEVAEGARDAFIQRLLQEADVTHAAPRPEARAEAEAVPPGLPPLPAYGGPRPAYLKAGDVPVWHDGPRLVAALTGALPSLGFLAFILLTGAFRQPGAFAYALPAVALLVALSIGFRVAQYRRTEYVATDRRVYARSGVVGTTLRQLTYDKITDIAVKQDVLGRILGYGSLTLNTAGSNEAAITMHGLAAPFAAKETIEALRGRYLREDAR